MNKSTTVAEFLLDRLREWGVNRIYGYAGEDVNEILGALDSRSDEIRFVPAVQGEMAAFMACAHAKLSGQVGVCLADSGPGALRLLPGLYDARKDNAPVVAILGQRPRMALGSDYQQEIDLVALFKDVARDYVQMAAVASQVRTLVDRAFRVAIAQRTVTAIIIPSDLQAEPMESMPRRHYASFSGVGHSRPRITPYAEDLKRAASILNSGQRVAILVGAGALDAGQEVEKVAEQLGAGVAKALLGKDVLGDDLPYVTGGIGLLGTAPTWEMMSECDTLLTVGSNFPYAEFLPKEGQARAIQIDIKPEHLGLRYPYELNLQGDAKETLRELLPLLQLKADRSWRDRVETSVSTWWKVLERRAKHSADPINPQRLFWELSPMLPEQSVLTCDSGSSVFWFARDIKLRTGMRALHSGGLASMGAGIPYALAAKLVYPGRPGFTACGDAAMQMSGLNALIDVASAWNEWEDPRLVVLILNNGDLSQISWEQRILQGNPRAEISQNVASFDYAQYARSLGLAGLRLEEEDQIVATFEEAFLSRRPVVIDALVDPNAAPLPPHIYPEQAINFAKAVFKGDSQAWGLLSQSIQDMMVSYTEKAKAMLSSPE